VITDEDLRATRPAPRSMQQAFGPYTDHTLEQMPSPRPAPWHKHDVIVTFACAIAVVALFVVVAVWG
jgi:hypothetical protein